MQAGFCSLLQISQGCELLMESCRDSDVSLVRMQVACTWQKGTMSSTSGAILWFQTWNEHANVKLWFRGGAGCLGLLQVIGRAEFSSFTSVLMVNFYRELECMGKV